MSILSSSAYALSESKAGVLSEEHLNLFTEALRLVFRARRAGLVPALLSGLAPTGSLLKLVTYLASDVQHGQAVPTVARMATAVHYLPAGRTSATPSCMLSGHGRPPNILLTSGVPREILRVPLGALQDAAASILFGVRPPSTCPSVVKVHGPSKPLATISSHTPPALRAVTHDVPDMLDCSVTVMRRPSMTFLDVSKGCVDILGAASTVRVLTSTEPVQVSTAPLSSALSLFVLSSESIGITSRGMLRGFIAVQPRSLVRGRPTATAAPALSLTPLLLNSPRLSSPSNPAAPAAHIDAGVVHLGKLLVPCRPTETVVVPKGGSTCQDTSIEEVVAAATGSTCVSTSSTCVGLGKSMGVKSSYLDTLELPQSPRGADVNNSPPTGLNSSTAAIAEARVRLVVEREGMEEMEIESMAGSLARLGEDVRTCSPLANSRFAAIAAYSEAGGRGVAVCQGSSDTVGLCTVCVKGVKRGCVTTEEFERMDGESVVWPEDDNTSWSDLVCRPGWRVGGLSKSEGATLKVCTRCCTAPQSLPTSVAAPCDFPRIDDNEFEMDSTEWFHHVRTRTLTGEGSPLGSFTRLDGRVLQKLETESLSQGADHSCADASHLSPVSACSMMAAEVSLNHHVAEESLRHTTTNPITHFIRHVKPSLHCKPCNAPTSPTNFVISDLTIDEELKPTLGNRVGAVVWNYLNKDSKTPETIATPQYKVTVLEEAGNGKLGAIRVERVNVPPKAKGAKSLPRRIRKGLIRAANGASSAARAARNTVSGIYYSIPRIQLRKPRWDPEAAAAAHRRIMQRHHRMYGRPQGGEDFKVEEWVVGDEDYEPPAF